MSKADRGFAIPTPGTSSFAIVTSLMIHVGVVGFALARTSQGVPIAIQETDIEMQLLPQSIGFEPPGLAPTPLLTIDAPHVATLRSTRPTSRARPSAEAPRAVLSSANAALTEPLRRFAITSSTSAQAVAKQ